MDARDQLRMVRPALLVGVWVLLTYGFRLVTAVRARTWDSVIASVVLLALSVVVAVLAARVRASGSRRALVPVVRLLDVLAIGWSAFRLTTVWTGQWSASFRAVHTVIAGVLLLLALWSVVRLGRAQDAVSPTPPDGVAAAPGPVVPAADGSGHIVPSDGGDPVSR